jgi:predicted nucleic acid-binding protein
MRVFFDSSGLAKRYIRERGSEKVEEVLAGASEVAVSLIAPPEIISAFCRLRRENAISAAQYGLAKKSLFADIEDISICNVTVPVVGKAIDLLEKHSLRTMDALHLACAIDWQADLFVSSDRRQISAALKSGLHVVQV